MENLFFPVEKVKLTDLGFNYPVPSDASHAVVGTIGGSKRILSFCSPDYGITPNRELANHLETVLQDSGVKIRSRHGSTRDNSSFRMEWVLDIHQESIQGGAIAPRIYLYNSYNRKTRFSASFGVMRLICTNGLTVLEESKVTSNLHSSGLDATSNFGFF